MCEMQYVKKINGEIEPFILKKFNYLVDNGAITNSHGHGFMGKKKDGSVETTKSLSKHTIMKEIKPFVELIFHSRYATHGEKTNENAHPFILDNIVWMHNGVLSNDKELSKEFKFKENTYPDTYIFGELVNHFIKAGKTPVEAIQETTKRIQGSFSVFMVIEGRTFYFKNGCNFKFSLHEYNKNQYIFGATDGDSLDSITQNFILGFVVQSKNIFKISEYEPIDGDIYEINDRKGIEKVGVFEINKKPISAYSSVFNHKKLSKKERKQEKKRLAKLKEQGIDAREIIYHNPQGLTLNMDTGQYETPDIWTKEDW